MSFFEEVFSRKITFPFDDENHYELFYFENVNRLKKFKAYFEDSDIKYKLSPWYGKLTDVVTVVQMPQIEDLLLAKDSKKERKGGSKNNNPNSGDEQNSYAVNFVAPAQLRGPCHRSNFYL